ncbi:unnamed protein product [Rotaria magnacalcarata]|uniref:Uncharacterized protein n=1 Tax=Rotaria magnacalcarata TaxID=392030 RepID=A0A819WBS5_9BILA|nr:unnamed protein product [Rotaria magnacalcarata]CAF2100785.1 unnamed protein product [Rotaria magnacalcarata]CAF4079081.1 unnamed protein product [Rotaria magnacalcarata]CAF4122698.1 unnamed protein product [Rotaria magnacalcarata]
MSVVPLGGSSIDIHPNARRQQNDVTVTGENREGNGINQLSDRYGLSVDHDQTDNVADYMNNRIWEWKWGKWRNDHLENLLYGFENG